MEKIDKLEICKQTRKIAADALHVVLKQLLATDEPISEVMLRDAWLSEMRKNKNIFPDGWYLPPPHGMAVLFATDEEPTRINFVNLRFEESWPSDDIFLDKKTGLIFVYSSPVDKETGIIGDFQMSLYFGKKPEIKKHLKNCLELDKEIFEEINVGMSFSELTILSERIMRKKGMTNDVSSLIYNTVTNIPGHTIVGSYGMWNDEEKVVIKNGVIDWDAAKDLISKKRVFIKEDEKFEVKPVMAFTIEPRPRVIGNPNLPTSLSYHTIALIKRNGEKEWITGFDDLFKLAGMDYML